MGCTLRNTKKKPHAGEIGEGENDLCLLNRNKAKSSHTGEIGKGESDVHLLSGVKNESVQYNGTTWSGSLLLKEATAAMTD